jgi:hypothetical protein
MVMMRPRFRGIIRLTASWIQKKVPLVLMAGTRSHSSSVISTRLIELMMPAQVLRISSNSSLDRFSAHDLQSRLKTIECVLR